jgi:hypothetical protein
VGLVLEREYMMKGRREREIRVRQVGLGQVGTGQSRAGQGRTGQGRACAREVEEFKESHCKLKRDSIVSPAGSAMHRIFGPSDSAL